MDKIKKAQANQWLRQYSKAVKNQVRLTVIVSFINGLLLILQLYLLSGVAYKSYIDNLSSMQLLSYFIGIGLIVIMRAILSWLREVVAYRSAVTVKCQLRDDLINHISSLGPIKASGISSGELVSSAMDQIEGLTKYFTHYLPQVTFCALMPIAILAFIFPNSIVSGLILLGCMPLIPLFMIVVGMGAESENNNNFKVLSRMSASFLDTLQGLTSLKLLGHSKSHKHTIKKHSDTFRTSNMKVLRIAFLSSAVLELFAAASIALVAVYLGLGFINTGSENSLWWSLTNITLQGGLFILLLAPEFFLPLRELSAHYHAKAEAIGASAEIQKIFDIKIPENGNKKFNDPIDAITFKDVSLTYPHQNRPALSTTNITITSKQKIAIVGISGSGKTSFTNLLMKFIQPTKGRIFVNNTDLTNLCEKSWLSKISWLGQNARLFSGTIADNLRLGNPHATDEQLWDALDKAYLKSTIEQLPNQLDHAIGEQSLGLSGGQARRLALARAYLKLADILILDEPTASLDIESADMIVSSLATTWMEKTVIMLTHEQRYLNNFDVIFVIKNGEIIEKDSYSSLKNNSSSYFNTLFYNQD